MTREECIALLDRYANYNGMGIPNLTGCKEAMKKAVELLSAKPCEDLEKAALGNYYGGGYIPKNQELREVALKTKEVQSFIAGAEWQKEQDQPITGNSLEKEWLRYVDKKKKECRGELPALGEYGWLQIARHFAEWQKKQMLKDAVEGEAEKDLGWHSVDESLPPVDEEVIVLADELNAAPIYKIALGHIVDRMHCSDYNGWNVPGVKYWMPMPKLPKEEEK